ncbi:MAG: Ig-like domain-containing protein [Oscillospiraceae bacterium]|nr:Ig-like domain-containing protein [Oscillospiraceae bacterium]
MKRKVMAMALASVVSLAALSGTITDYASVSAYALEEVDSAAVEVKSIAVAKGMTKQIPVTGNSSGFKWSVDNESKVTISDDGVITGLALGSTKINAEASDGKVYTIKVSVVRVEVELSESTIMTGKSAKLIVNTAEQDLNYKWYSSNENASVEDGVVTGKKAGTAKVGIVLEDGKIYSAKIKVKAQKVETPSIKAKASTYESITVSWNKQEAAEYYKVYYSDSKTGKYTLVKNGGNIKGTSFTCGGLKNQTKYFFKVKAFNKTSESKFSEPAYAVTGRPQYSKEQLQKKIQEEQDNINYYKMLQSVNEGTLADARTQYNKCKKERDEWLKKLNAARTQRTYREYNPETGRFEWAADRKQIAYCQENYDYYSDLVDEYEKMFKQYDYSSKIKDSTTRIQTYKKMLNSY